MVGTLPGRTHGLGLVTEPLMADLHLDRNQFADINMFATLVDAGLFPRRLAHRSAEHALELCAGGAVPGAVCWAMSGVTGVVALVVLVTLTRAPGQSALSVVSMAVVGKWFRSRVGVAMSIYSVLDGAGLRAQLLGRRPGRSHARLAHGLVGDFAGADFRPGAAGGSIRAQQSGTLRCAVANRPRPLPCPRPVSVSLRAGTPAFWIFALAALLYGLVASGMGLFNEAILRERNFDQQTYHDVLALGSFIGLGGQMLAGVLAWRFSLAGILAGAMFVYAAALLWLPRVETLMELYGYVLLMGISGGVITVVFFAIWPQAFGRASLGRIRAPRKC